MGRVGCPSSAFRIVLVLLSVGWGWEEAVCNLHFTSSKALFQGLWFMADGMLFLPRLLRLVIVARWVEVLGECP